MIANYCFPSEWPKKADCLRVVKKFPSVRLSFGIHPKTVQTTIPDLLEEYLDILDNLLKYQNTVAIGECGLDTSNVRKPLRVDHQVEFLERQLELCIDV